MSSVRCGLACCAATAASLGGAAAAAHTALMAVAWLCFTFGDVGSSLAQAYLPAFSGAPAPPPATRPPPSQTARAINFTWPTAANADAPPAAATATATATAATATATATAPPVPPAAVLPAAASFFDLAAARPTIAMLLRVTVTISFVVVALSSAIIGVFAGQLTPDPLVQVRLVGVARLVRSP